MLKENQILDVYAKRNELLMYDPYYGADFFLLVQDIGDCYFYPSLRIKKKNLMDKAHLFIYKCVLEYKNKENYRANSAISTLHPLFQDASQRVQLFKVLYQIHLTSIHGALVYLNK